MASSKPSERKERKLSKFWMELKDATEHGTIFSGQNAEVAKAGVVLLDSGTGETKVIYVNENDKGQVVTEEVKILPSFKGIREDANCEKILQDYVDAIEKACDEKKTTRTVAGMTAWFRAIPEEERQFYRDFFKNRLQSVEVLELKGSEEGMFEAAAVNYAAEKSGLGKPNLQLAAGGGSINLVYENAPFNIETGFRAGQAKLLAGGLPAVKQCEEDATKYIDEFLAEQTIFKEPEPGVIIAISACYYAAKGTNIANAEAVSSEDVVRVFAERKQKIIESIKDGKIEDKKVAQELSNMILQTQVFKRLTHPQSKVYFRRDWVIEGEKFRTTWTAGYFICNYSTYEKKRKVYPWAKHLSDVVLCAMEAAKHNKAQLSMPRSSSEPVLSPHFANCKNFKEFCWGETRDLDPHLDSAYLDPPMPQRSVSLPEK